MNIDEVIRKLEEIHANYKNNDNFDFGFKIGIEKAIEVIKNENSFKKFLCEKCAKEDNS